MAPKEAQKLLMSSKWNCGSVVYTFRETSFSTNTNIQSQYDIEEKEGELYAN